MKRLIICIICLLVCALWGCSSEDTPYVPTGDGLYWDADPTEDTTAPQPPETTEPPSVFEAKVYVYNALGVAEEYIIKSATLPSAALESVELSVGDGVHAELLGW